MKKLIIIALVCLAIGTKAQTIDTAYHAATACKIQPFKAKFNDTVNVTHLAAQITYDDLKANCSVAWKLMDDNGNVHMGGNAGIGGTDYQNWNGNNLYPFTFLGALLGLTFINN
ncbi:MAG: hypothetical protein ACXVAY_01360 [Mucilaginibacter sp.]